MVERRADPIDGRPSRLVITDAGRRRAEAWLADYGVAAEEVFAVLPAKQRSELLAALRVLASAQTS